jgi:hypothetical protein
LDVGQAINIALYLTGQASSADSIPPPLIMIIIIIIIIVLTNFHLQPVVSVSHVSARALTSSA